MCKVTQAAIAADGQAIDKAALALAAEVQTTNPTLAAEITAAGQVVLTVTSGWQTGTPLQDVNTAATALEAILGAIPITAPYATFVAIAVAALDVLIGNLGTQSAQTPNVVANAQLIQAHIESLPENPYRGYVTIRPSLFGIRHAFASAWNKQRELEPQFNFPKI